MRYFIRAMKFSWPYRYKLLISLLSAVFVASLWSLNLSAIYPILKILGTDKNLQTWVEEEIALARVAAEDSSRLERIDQLRSYIRILNDNPESPDRENQLRRLTRELAQIEGEVTAASTKLYRFQLLRDKVIRHLPTNRFETFVWIVGAVILCVMVKGFFEFWQESLVGIVVSRTLYDLRNHFYRAVVHQDARQIHAAGTSELMARLTNDMEQLGGGMKILYGKMVVEPLKAIACLTAACMISWQLTITFLILVVPAVVTLGRVSRLMKRAARKVLERMSELYKILRETFDGIRVVKAFTMEPAERRRFRNANQEFYRRSVRVITIDAIAGPMVELFGVAAVGLALLAGAYLVMEQKQSIFGIRMTEAPLSFESLLQLYVFLAATADPVRRLSSVYTKIQAGAAAAERAFVLLDRVPMVTPNPQGPLLPRHQDGIEFRNLCFSYVPGQDPGTLSQINLKIEAGETVALVGPNGCGKTTLLGMVPRFFDPDYGGVYIDGVNIRGVNLRSLRKQIGLVTQDTILFDDTILNNIAYGKPGATFEEVQAAAKKAFAHEFIITREKGYDEQVGDLGGQLSGGQKQRIALARAILRNPRILILDEATSQIDPESEQKIHQALKEFVHGRTTFLITHRRSTLELADRIVVMEAGKIVGVGSHAELAAECETYRRLYEVEILSENDVENNDSDSQGFRAA